MDHDILYWKNLETKAKQEIKKLSVPTITDYDLIPRVFELFCSAGNYSQSYLESKKNWRKEYLAGKFVMVAIKLYHPGYLANKKMPNNLRRKLSQQIHKQESDISNIYTKVAYQYENIKSLRCQVDYLYEKVLESLSEDGLL